MGDITLFDLDTNPTLLDRLNNNIVMVGLNIAHSRSFSESFRNFHNPNPRANDFKIRYAFHDTQYYGAYMTDIIKNFVTVDSTNVLKYLKNSPGKIVENIEKFREELLDLGSSEPLILSFGSVVYKILAKNLNKKEYSRLVKLTHYSHQIGKEKYRQQVLSQIDLTVQ